MPEIIVKGVDSADAMEQLEKLLGKDAMILKTVRRDGFVEITGTNEPTPTPKAAAAPATPTEPFSHILAETLKKQHARDMGTFSDPAPMPAAPAPKPVQQPTDVSQTLQMPQTGYLLVGPKGAGKSRLALQIASNLVEQGAPRPRVVFWGNGSRADGAYLAAKCQIMGLEMIHASDADFSQPNQFDPTSDVIVASANRSHHSIQNIPVVSAFSALLVVPAGLSAASAERVFAAWPTVSDIVFATHDTLPWSHEDQNHATTGDRRIIALSDQNRILGALTAPKPMAQPTNTPKPTQAPSLFQKRWGGQNQTPKHPQTQRKTANDTGLPLLGTGSAMFNAMPHLKHGAEQ